LFSNLPNSYLEVRRPVLLDALNKGVQAPVRRTQAWRRLKKANMAKILGRILLEGGECPFLQDSLLALFGFASRVRRLDRAQVLCVRETRPLSGPAPRFRQPQNDGAHPNPTEHVSRGFSTAPSEAIRAAGATNRIPGRPHLDDYAISIHRGMFSEQKMVCPHCALILAASFAFAAAKP